MIQMIIQMIMIDDYSDDYSDDSKSEIIASTCIDGSPDMRIRKNKGKQKYQQILGNSHIS